MSSWCLEVIADLELCMDGPGGNTELLPASHELSAGSLTCTCARVQFFFIVHGLSLPPKNKIYTNHHSY